MIILFPQVLLPMISTVRITSTKQVKFLKYLSLLSACIPLFRVLLSASANPRSYLVVFLRRNIQRLHAAVCSLDGGENHCTVFLLSFECSPVTLVSENLWLKVLESIILFKDETLHPPLQKMTKPSYLTDLFFKIHRSVQRTPVYTQQYNEIMK